MNKILLGLLFISLTGCGSAYFAEDAQNSASIDSASLDNLRETLRDLGDAAEGTDIPVDDLAPPIGDLLDEIEKQKRGEGDKGVADQIGEQVGNLVADKLRQIDEKLAELNPNLSLDLLKIDQLKAFGEMLKLLEGNVGAIILQFFG